MHEAYENLLFDVRRSVRYHQHRRRFFELVNNVTAFASLVFGSATIAAFGTELAGDWPIELKLAPAALVTLLYSWVLVSGVVRKAWLHADLARRFVELERMLEVGRSNQTDELLTRATDKRLEIEADEPPIHRVLDLICHNEVVRGMGYGAEEYVRIGFWHRRLAQFLTFDGLPMPEKG